MPPAPTTPSTAAARMLISKRYSQKATISGSTCGRTPQRWTWTDRAPVGTRRLDRSGVDALDHLRGQLAQRARRVDADRQRAGDGAEPGDGDEDRDGEDDLREGADGVEELADDVRDEAARDVPRAEEAQRQREHGADDGADPRDLERLDHGLERAAAGSSSPGRPRGTSREKTSAKPAGSSRTSAEVDVER